MHLISTFFLTFISPLNRVKEFLEIINIIKCHDFITDTTHMTHLRKMTLIALLNSYSELEFMPHWQFE